jgi:hypothetical protein
MAISVAFWFMAHARTCADPGARRMSAQTGRRPCLRAGRPMSCWWQWPTRRPGLSGQCSAEVKLSKPKLGSPHNDERRQTYCEGDDEVMAKQGSTRDRPNPRCCQSLELARLTGRRSFGFHQGQRSACRSEKAGYMTANSTAASNHFSPCNTGGVHT